MESALSHSRQPITLLPKKGGYNGGSITTKTVCDDLMGGQARFGAPTTLSPRVEDYTEIFGGFHAPRASSIPVLDLPVANEEANALFDARSCSVLDYNEVFAGFDAQDFAISFEELVKAMTREKSGGGGFCASYEEAWTPEDAEGISEESDHSATSRCFSNGDTRDSTDRSMEFNISYYKTNHSGNEVAQNGITHVTQVLDVPGYAYMVDRTASLPKSVHECSFLEVSDDGHISIDLSGEMTGERNVGRTVQHLANDNSCGPSSEYDSRPERVLVRSGSLINEGFVTISDVSLKTRPSHLPPPSRPPPPFDVKNRDSTVLTGDSASVDSGGTAGDGSPSYFDVEVDASSSAAASAAAMKEAMEQAQAKLRSAKELMERKKDGFHSRSRSSSKNDRKVEEEKVVKIVDGSGCREEERSQNILAKENGQEHSALAERQQVSVSTQIVPDAIEEIKTPSMSKKSTEENHVSESLASQDSKIIHGADEWKEDTEFFELVKTDESEKAFDQPKSENILVQNINVHENGEKDNKAVPGTVHQEQENKKRVKAVRADHVFEECVKNSSVFKDTSECVESFARSEAVKVTREQKGLERKIQAGEEELTVEENERKFRLDHRRVGTENKHSMSRKLEKHENIGIESKSTVKPVVRCEEKEPMPIEVDRSMEDKRRFGIGREHNEEKQKLNIEQANESVKLDIEQAENERRLMEALEAVEQKRMTEALKRESNETNQKGTYRKEENEKRLKESLKKEENEMRQREASEREENGKRGEDTLERHELEKQFREEEKRPNDDYEGEEAENRCKETYEKKQETRTRLKEASEQDRSGKSRLSDVGEEIKMEIKIAHDVEEIQEACEWQEIEVKLKNAGNQQIKASGMVKAFYEREKEEDVIELPCSDVKVNMASESGKDTAQSNSEETRSSSQADSEVSKRRNGKDNLDDLMARRVLQESVETGRKMSDTQPGVLPMQGSTCTHKTAQQVNADQNMEKKMKNINETISEEEKENERKRREKELEEECLRKIEEEREREREREKDRMAVDRATLEARDRAYTDARERAERAAIERATSEARQRALNEARERLEKACAEAREKSQADKASVEARLRAERAAVERATAEARERAFGKAMAERTAFETRDRMERSVSDKFSASSRTSGMRPSSLSSDLQSQSAGLLNGSRHLYSSVYSSSYLERSEGIEGESDQRCKARLERHQRTADRAAKALAEKNMRDLLAQREQAERNRLAETLDAEVKRWSSGKEGNLRALLSTLQYILGPGSGWQPIPLTEVITAAAVKKAYRKATLCVHPDKLQQRGASIQHKYICEKVFDLLKDAWNKFNSEER